MEIKSQVSRGMNHIDSPSLGPVPGSSVDVNTEMKFKPRDTNQIEAAKDCVTSGTEQLLPSGSPNTQTMD